MRVVAALLWMVVAAGSGALHWWLFVGSAHVADEARESPQDEREAVPSQAASQAVSQAALLPVSLVEAVAGAVAAAAAPAVEHAVEPAVEPAAETSKATPSRAIEPVADEPRASSGGAGDTAAMPSAGHAAPAALDLRMDCGDVEAVTALIRAHGVALCAVDAARGVVVELVLQAQGPPRLGRAIDDARVRVQHLPTHDPSSGRRLRYADWLAGVRARVAEGERAGIELGLRRDGRLEELLRAAVARAVPAGMAPDPTGGVVTVRPVLLAGGQIGFEVGGVGERR